MKKNRIFAVCVLCFAAAIIAAAVIDPDTERSFEEQMEQSLRWAEIDTAPAMYADETLLEGTKIKVYRDEVERIAARYASGGVENGEELAKQYILRREALYYAGLEAGFSASEEEVQEKIHLSLEMSQDAKGREYFDAYLEATGLTEQEYWESQAEQIQKEIVIGKYLASLKKEHTFSTSEEWKTFEAELVQELIEADGVFD